MSRPRLRWALGTAAAATLIVTTAPASADGPGTPNQPPPDLPPSQPLPAQPEPQSPQVQQQPQGQPQQVPPYATYQRRRHKSSHWYGWQTLIVDGAWIIGGPVVSAASPGTGGALILGGYFLGPPIVHWAHGQIGRGFADLGIRVGAPIVLGTLGYLAFQKDGSNNYEGLAGAVIGVLLGMVAAIVVDASVLAYEPADDDDEDALHRTRRRNAMRPVTIAPWLTPRSEGGGMLGVSGTLY